MNHELKIPFSMYVSGYKYNEISEKLNLPLGTVKSRDIFCTTGITEILERSTDKSGMD